MGAADVVGNNNDRAHAITIPQDYAYALYLVAMSQDARLDEERSTQRRAQVLNYNYVDTSQITNKELFRDVLTNEELYRYKAIPITKNQNGLLFGILTNTSQQSLKELRDRFIDYRVGFAIISETGYRDYMKLYDPPKQIEYHDIEINQAGTDQLVAQVSQVLEGVRADDMLAYLVSQAHGLGASDIHLETQKDYARIRFRIDGVLHPIAQLQPDKYRVLISAIASAGNVSTSTDEAQQGHIAQTVNMADGSTVDINVRLETVPTINGMDVVMRLFNMDASKYNLERLGLTTSERQVVDAIISQPSGLVMVVGPTGSGKTTTLYSILNTLNTDARKIITIEDPVEYGFPGITQIPVHPNESGDDNSFADKLRAVLRLDPDIVMVGEVRDHDTAKTALQAALTGHLVLCTFHASSAAAALTRLADVIGQNPLFVSAIRLIMAQRLVRRLDPETKTAYDPTEAEWQRINSVLDSLPPGYEKPNVEGLQLYKAGSSEKNPYGYEGQIAVREQFTMSDDLRHLLEKPSNSLSAQSIEEAAHHSGMLTMSQDAVLKAIAGETSLDEVFRVLG
ncbi:MAG: ral secretion pathway protein GspE [Candidatus Saccharibacteria bacterium]|nr:ral secretion pathway protein GspE [Candidatus Saccharibacteria bacterium]